MTLLSVIVMTAVAHAVLTLSILSPGSLHGWDSSYLHFPLCELSIWSVLVRLLQLMSRDRTPLAGLILADLDSSLEVEMHLSSIYERGSWAQEESAVLGGGAW